MTAIRYEFIQLSTRTLLGPRVGTAGKLTVTGAATAGGSRPTVPAGAEAVRLLGIDGTSIVSINADPTATQANGFSLAAGEREVVPCQPGDLISAIEMT